MKNVRIYSIGSCVTDTRIGRYEVVLEYGENRRYLKKDVVDTTAHRCIIQGFIDAVKVLKYSCEVELVSTTKLGLSGLKRNKGPNVDLLKQLVAELSLKECEFTFSEREGEGEAIKAVISAEAEY